VFLDVRDAAAKILESTTVADIIASPGSGKRSRGNRKQDKSGRPTIVPSGGQS
jgi:hypothetical protein